MKSTRRSVVNTETLLPIDLQRRSHNKIPVLVVDVGDPVPLSLDP